MAPLPTLMALAESTVLPTTTSTPALMQTATLLSVPDSTAENRQAESGAPAVVESILTDAPIEATPLPASTVSQERLSGSASNTTSVVVLSRETPASIFVEQSAVASPQTEAATALPTTATTQVIPVSPTVLPTIQPTTSVSGITEPGIPLSQGLEVGFGQMRVIASTRNAEQSIRDLGGMMPPAPADHSWLLVEALLICHEPSRCAVNPSSFSVVGASGMTYAVSSELMITPLLGSSIANGQAWGYLGFTIPTHETTLRLVMEQDGKNYVFALQ
jgi:hypothetical protein